MSAARTWSFTMGLAALAATLGLACGDGGAGETAGDGSHPADSGTAGGPASSESAEGSDGPKPTGPEGPEGAALPPPEGGEDPGDAGTAGASSDAGSDGGAPDAGAEFDAGEEESDAGPPSRPYPEPGAFEPNRGPGGPKVTFAAEQLFQNCAFLDGGPDDVTDHHNLVTMYDGYLMMPWAPEFGAGGITFWDISDPCQPKTAGYGTSRRMRETHSVGFAHLAGRRFAVVNHYRSLLEGGIEFWDISDPASPTAISQLATPGFIYPDAYVRVTLSVFWQAPYVYVAGADNGVYIVDATNPEKPELVNQYQFQPLLRAGQVIVVGNLLFVSAAEGARFVMLDISDPKNPAPIPGGDTNALDENGAPREHYFSNLSGGYAYFAPKQDGGGLMIMDIHDPTNPKFTGAIRSNGNGGYVFTHDQFAFVGESNFATIYDIANPAEIKEVQRLNLTGDLDTLTPIGNVTVLSVDDKADPDKGSAIAPWQTEPDSIPPRVTWAYPPDGATDLRTTSRVGITFNEFVDVKSAWEGSVRLYETGTNPAATRVDGHVSAQDTIVNFWPLAPLKPGTSYTLELPAGGIHDFTGNAIAEPFTMTFTTGPE